MDDEIDLRRYVQAVLRHWRLILLLTVIGSVAAAGISLALPNMYEAVALISVATSRTTLQLQGINQDPTLPVRAYPELALSGDVLLPVYNKAAGLLPPSVNTLAKFSSALIAESASDPTLLRLRVRDRDPQRASQIANMWAEAFAARAGQLYGQDQANLVSYQQELSDAKTRLDQADSDLATFESTNRVSILSAHLDSQQASLTDYLNQQHQLQGLTQDVQNLLGRLNGLPAANSASLADDLALVSVASRIYGVQSSPTNTVQTQLAVPIQLQVGAGQSLAGPTVADQRALAQNLSDTIAARLNDITNQVTTLEPLILNLQGQVAEAKLKEVELTRARDLAQTEYVRLADQVQQASIAIQQSTNTVQIASRAIVPTQSISPRRTLNILLGAALGVAVGVLIALGLEFLSQGATASGTKNQ